MGVWHSISFMMLSSVYVLRVLHNMYRVGSTIGEAVLIEGSFGEVR